MQVTIREAKRRLSALIESVRTGQEVTIANRGKPVAKLVPADDLSADKTAVGKGLTILNWLDRHPLPPHAQRSAEELDAAVAEIRGAWD
jgi:prevent-host-death family protein